MDRVSTKRNIEFLPKFLQSGLSLLSYFPEFFSKKHPKIEIETNISQDKNNILLTIFSSKENQHVVESTLEEFGELVQGNTSSKEVNQNELLTLELRNELRIAQMRLEQQQAMLELEKKRQHEYEKLHVNLKDQIPTSKIHIENDKKSTNYRDNVDKLNQQINRLSKDIKEKEKVSAQEINGYRDEVEKAKVELQATKEELESVQLGQGVDGAIDAISKSITDTDKAIKRSIRSSNLFSIASFLTYGLSFFFLINLLFLDLTKTANGASVYFHVFPVLATFLIGTAFLKHDAKLRQHYLIISKQKNSLEKATGLLEASRHLGGVKNLNPLVHDSFSMIRMHLLKEGADLPEIKDDIQPINKTYENIIMSLIKDNKSK